MICAVPTAMKSPTTLSCGAWATKWTPKESEFFQVISKLNKQVIIVTKSFLKEGSDGEVVLDRSKVDEIKGRIFRIEKKKPFDDKKLATIQTVISKIK